MLELEGSACLIINLALASPENLPENSQLTKSPMTKTLGLN